MKPALIQVLEYDANSEIIRMVHFHTVEDAIEWCQEQKPNLIELDTEFGFQMMTNVDIEHLSRSSEFPTRWYEVHGVEEDGQIRYFEDTDYRNAVSNSAED